MMNSSWEI